MALVRAMLPSPTAPVAAGICPSTMFTAIPVRNPTMTELATKRVYLPRRSIPARTMNTPAKTVSRNSAPGRSAGEMSASVDPAANAAALVVVTTTRLVLANNPPAIGPAMLA